MEEKNEHRSTRQKQMRLLTNLATFRWKSDLNAVHSAFIRGFGSAPISRLLDAVSYEILRRCLLKQQTYF